MTPQLPRRDFLKQTTTAILGLSLVDSLAADEKTPVKVDWLKLARERMEREVKPGVILVVPPRQRVEVKPDAKIELPQPFCTTSMQLAEQLAALLGTTGDPESNPPYPGDRSARVIFCQAVFVCLPFEQAKELHPDLTPGTAALLLGVNGQLVDTLKAEPELFGQDFVPKMTRFLHGANGERLAATLRAQRKALGPKHCDRLDAALSNLNSDDFALRQSASRQLAEHAPRATAVLVSNMKNPPSLEVRRRIELLVDELYAAVPPGKPGPSLPFGVAWGNQEFFDPCLGCGLGRVNRVRTRRFLEFVTEPKK